MNVLGLTSCIPYVLGHPRILGVSALHEIERKTKMFVKGISTEDFLKNCFGELSNSSSQRRTRDCFGEISSNSPRRVAQCIYRNSIVSFREKKSFVLKTGYFTHIRFRHM